MMFCMLLIAPWLFLSRVDAGASPGPPVTLNNTPNPPARPLPTQPPPPITQYAPPINALVPLDKRAYLPPESAAKPALDCTYTKRVPRPRTTPETPNNKNNDQPTETLTSYINCRGCTTATAITVPHLPARAAGPAWRFPLPWPNPTPPAAGGTTTVYECIKKRETGAPSTPTIGASGPRRTRPVEKTVVDS